MESLPSAILQWVLVAFLAILGIIVLLKLWSHERLDTLVSEPDGKASLSRFQFLLFTFVIVTIYTVLSLQQGALLEISDGVLGLLGISGGGYVISKGIQMQAGKKGPAPSAVSSPGVPNPLP